MFNSFDAASDYSRLMHSVWQSTDAACIWYCKIETYLQWRPNRKSALESSF